ncbi:MAG: MFS transporter [Pseudomonadota bacterium]
MAIAKAAMVLVILVDVMGQGLAFPIFSVLILSDSAGMLAEGTSAANRQALYGLLVGVFFLFWFFGAIYVSRLSDSVGRKRGVLICLTGTLAGYLLAFIAIEMSSFWLLLLSRAITGFTAGNQPIAQAALVDLSRDDAEKARNMGLVMLGAGIGLVAGPLIGGLFSSSAFAGLALTLPFLVGAALVAATMLLVMVFFQETSTTRVPLSIHPSAIFTLLWQITKRPVVLKVAVPYLFYMMCFITFYVFFDNALERWYGYGTTGQSAAMFALGVTLAVTSTPALQRINALAPPRTLMVAFTLGALGLIALFVAVQQPVVSFLCITLMGVVHAYMYPAFLGLFSKATSAEDQGWVMGVAVALFTLASAIASFIGGLIGAADFPALFGFGGVAALVTLATIAWLWRREDVKAIVADR